jgi:GNAT superfamily N-acetyltransferase
VNGAGGRGHGAFRARGEDLSRYFYFGESVLSRAYRGAGIGVRFFEEREAHARACGAAVAAFCAVVRASDHPARPRDYVPLDAFWQRRGFAVAPGLLCQLSWKEIGADDESPKAMQFWTKRLS